VSGQRGFWQDIALFWVQLWAILWKDIRYELRSKQTWLGMGMFALLVLVIFNFTYDLRSDIVLSVAPGALWVAFIFASLLGLGRTVAAEREVGSLDRLLLTPVDRKAIYLAKLLGNLLFIGVVEIVALPVFALLFNLPLLQGGSLLMLVVIALLGALGIASVGTLFSVLTALTRARELLLPILIFPLIVPVVISAVRATTLLFAPSATEPPWLSLLIVFDVIFISVSTLLFHYVVEE
jgi:heme exporter protein B